MSEESEGPYEHPKAGSAWVTILACVVLAAVAGGVLYWIFSTEPEAKQGNQTRESAMLVEVVEAERGNFRPRIQALGRVEAAREIQLSPRVSGEVVERAETFSPGGFVARGEMLLKIDPADYENALRQRQSELSRAKAELEIEQGRGRVAESDFELLDESLAIRNRGLALREPQLNTAIAMVESAQAAVDQASLALERTSMVAPFDVQVIERMVDVGSQVAPGDELGRLVGLDEYWVVATVPLSALPWVRVAARDGGEGSAVEVRDRSAWPPGAVRSGRVERLIGSLDEETRLARLLVTVEDPLAREPANRGEPGLILGAIVETIIEGEELENVVRLSRQHLREGDTVWVMDPDSSLRIAEVAVRFRDKEHAYVSAGLEGGERVVTTSLATVAPGAALRLEGGDG